MPTITLHLHKKALRVEASSGSFQQRLTYEAYFQACERLRTDAGTEIERGYIEFVPEKSRNVKATLHFSEPSRDLDTGEIVPAIVSFFSPLPTDLFSVLWTSAKTSDVVMNLITDQMGVVRVEDSYGFEKVWDVDRQNPISVRAFEVVLSDEEQLTRITDCEKRQEMALR